MNKKIHVINQKVRRKIMNHNNLITDLEQLQKIFSINLETINLF